MRIEGSFKEFVLSTSRSLPSVVIDGFGMWWHAMTGLPRRSHVSLARDRALRARSKLRPANELWLDRSGVHGEDLRFAPHPLGSLMPIEDQVLHYALYLLGLGRSARAIEARRATLTEFTEWLKAEGRSLRPDGWSPDLIATFIAKQQLEAIQQGQPLSMGAIAKITRSVEAFGVWIKAVERSENEANSCD